MEHDRLMMEMIAYYEGDPKRIQHWVKVFEFARLIGNGENLPYDQQYILETAAIVHDIGIKPAEEKYGSCGGKLQEQEGPAAAEKILEKLCYPSDVISRVSYLVGHHHTYRDITGMDYQILVEADFLVNLYEDNLSMEAVQNAYNSLFATQTGKKICRTMFGMNQ